MTTDYKSTSYIRVQFAKHHKAKYRNAHLELNKAYSFSMDEIQDLFTDDSRTELKPSCMRIIREKITSTMKQCVTKDGQDPTKVPSRFSGSPHSCHESESGQAMRQNNDILHALNVASEKKQNQITFRMGTLHLDFKHKFIATDLDTWGPEIDTSDNPRQEDKPQ